jgi:uncharacterized repeat protein (TIGR02543 family)
LFVLFLALTCVYTGCSDDKTAEVYTVTFNADGGAPTPEPQQIEAGGTAIAPTTNPAKQGYVFLFWHLNSANTAYDFKTPVNSNITLVAEWQEAAAEYWQVTWNLDGGVWPEDDNHATEVVKGGMLAEPKAPTKERSNFEGWYKEADLTNKVTFPYNVTGVTTNITLYARWITATTYYVDNIAGDDENDGLSSDRAWKTLDKVNSAEFEPGNFILFKRGGSWKGCLKIFNVAGTEDKRITYSAYGTGDKPKLIGDEDASALLGVIVARNPKYLTIENFDVSNPVTARPPTKNLRGISVDAQVADTYPGVIIKDNYIHDVDGVITGNWHLQAGIWVRASTAEALFMDIVIEKNKLERISCRGIQFGDGSNNNEAFFNYGVTIRENEIDQTSLDAILIFKSKNILIENNKINRTGDYKLIETNRAINAIELHAKNVTIQYNEVANTARMGTALDAQAFSIGDNCSGTIDVQYNYSHGNQGGFLMIASGTTGITNARIRYNISENDGVEGTRYKILKFDQTVVPIQLYNNTVYHATRIGILNSGAGNTHNGLVIKNNIFYAPEITYEDPNIVYDSNLYFSAGKAENDANAVLSNPNFTSPGSGVNGYKLPSTSPAANAGAIIPDNGGRDYFGNQVSATAKPTIGAFQL